MNKDFKCFSSDTISGWQPFLADVDLFFALQYQTRAPLSKKYLATPMVWIPQELYHSEPSLAYGWLRHEVDYLIRKDYFCYSAYDKSYFVGIIELNSFLLYLNDHANSDWTNTSWPMKLNVTK